MLRTRYYECPDCRQVFGFQHHLTNESVPRYCPMCGNNMSAEPEPVFVPAAPHIGKTIGKSADQVYRQMEQAGADHMQLAAEIGGGDASDYSGLKVTDMPDYLRPGDIASKIASNPVSQAMTNSGQGGFAPLNGMSGADFAATTASGAFPRRGETMRRQITSGHAARADVMKGMGVRERRR